MLSSIQIKSLEQYSIKKLYRAEKMFRPHHTFEIRRPNQGLGLGRVMRGRRCGLSLLEVILAVAILGTSMAIIGQVFFAGYRSAVKARDLSDATILCDSVMAELSAGSLEVESTAGATINGIPGWEYSIETTESEIPGLLLTTVSVSRQNVNSVSMSIVRMLPDPNYSPEEDQ